jgi:hypothetical protein
MSDITAAIEKEIKAIPKDGIRLKKFRKPILDEFSAQLPEQEVKEKFAACLEKFCSDGVVSLDGGILTRMRIGKCIMHKSVSTH